MSTIVQLVGAGLVLLAFCLGQRGWLLPTSSPSLWLNAVGAGILAVLAFAESQWGFLVLEATWSTVAIAGLLTRFLSSGPARETVAATTKEMT